MRTELKSQHVIFVSPAQTYAQEYIIVVEVNVSEVILIQQLKSSFSIQLDNSTNITAVDITTGTHGTHCPFTYNTHYRVKKLSTG